jgi:hypothetical protein
MENNMIMPNLAKPGFRKLRRRRFMALVTHPIRKLSKSLAAFFARL